LERAASDVEAQQRARDQELERLRRELPAGVVVH
jgi:hypothetical protein